MKLKEVLIAAAIGLASPSVEADLSGNTIIPRENSGGVYNKSRFDGEYDLVNIASNSSANDIWVYSSGIWHDVGIVADNGTSQPDISLIERIIGETSGNIFYYSLQQNQPCSNANSGRISLQPISISSIFDHVYLSELARNNNRRLYSKVVDEHGIWSYSVSSRLADNIIQLNVEVLENIGDIASQAADWLLDIPRTIFASRLQEYKDTMQSNGVYVSYHRIR